MLGVLIAQNLDRHQPEQRDQHRLHELRFGEESGVRRSDLGSALGANLQHAIPQHEKRDGYVARHIRQAVQFVCLKTERNKTLNAGSYEWSFGNDYLNSSRYGRISSWCRSMVSPNLCSKCHLAVMSLDASTLSFCCCINARSAAISPEANCFSMVEQAIRTLWLACDTFSRAKAITSSMLVFESIRLVAVRWRKSMM